MEIGLGTAEGLWRLVRRLRHYFWGRHAGDLDEGRPWWQRGRVWDSLTDGIRDETMKTNPG